MTTIRHGGPCGLRSEMRSAERAGKSVVFLCRSASKCLPHAQRGGSGRGVRGRVASPLAHDKGYYHSCLGRSRKLAFGHTRRLEPQPWGAVTRRAVAQRRSRASGLTRLLAEAIRGFDSGFGLGFVVGPLARSAAPGARHRGSLSPDRPDRRRLHRSEPSRLVYAA